VALQEEIQLPAHQGLAEIHKVKILHIEQTGVPIDPLQAARSPISAQHSKQIGAATRRGLPPRQTEPPELECRLDGRSVRLRSVRELMTDDSGNFYEVNGRKLRPLGELVRDEHGRVFEVRPTSDNPATESANEQPNGSAPHRQADSKTENDNRAEPPAQPTAQAVPKEPPRGYSKIIADPGLYLKIPWARAKGELTTLIQHPEKLSDADEIECYAQIYEAQRTLPAARLAATELGDGALHSQLHPLTQDKAQMLGIPQLFKPIRHPFETQPSTRQVYAGQRVYRLWPVFDPTVERGENLSGRSGASGDKNTAPRCQVPQEYLNPLQFKNSREEVLYDMRSIFGTLPVEGGALARWFVACPVRLLKMLIVLLATKRRLKKWRTIIEGKSLDEQLWRVTPPRGFSYHPALRRWAEGTLTRAGYDPKRMVLEWEIFWRRKGWK